MMKITAFLLCSILVITAKAQKKTTPAKKTPVDTLVLRTAQDSLSYAFAVNIIKEMQDRSIKTLNYPVLAKAIQEGVAGKKNLLTAVQAREVISKNLKVKFKHNITDGQAFLDSNKNKPGVITLPSGLQYQVIQQGTGPFPTTTDTVTAHYTLTLINGKKIESSYDSKEPIVGTPTSYIKGWGEALLLMNAGSKYRLFVPQQLAYGERGFDDLEPYSTLIFDMEVIKIGK